MSGDDVCFPVCLFLPLQAGTFLATEHKQSDAIARSMVVRDTTEDMMMGASGHVS